MDKLTDLEHKELSKNGSQRTIKELRDCASSILLLDVQLEDVEEILDSARSSVEERSKELKLKEEEFVLKEKALEKRCREMESEKKDLERRCRDVELKEKYLDKCSRDYELKEKRFRLKERSCGKLLIEFEFKEKVFRERCRDLEVNAKRYEEEYKRLELAEKWIKKQLEEIKRKEEEFGLKERDFEQRYRDLEAKGKHYDECLRIIQLREKEIDDLYAEHGRKYEQQSSELEFNVKRCEQRFKDLESKEKELAKRSKELETKRCLASALHPQVETDAAGIFSVKYSIDHSSRAHLRFCVNMDGKDLQMFLNESLKKHDSVRTKVAVALQLSTDPAKLILDAMDGFYPPHLSKGDKEFKGKAARGSCILLLEHLNELSPEIKPCVRETAMRLASEGLTKMRVESGHELEVLGFLWLIAAFKLADNYDAEELLNYLQFVSNRIKSDEILKALGLKDRINSFMSEFLQTKPRCEALYRFPRRILLPHPVFLPQFPLPQQPLLQQLLLLFRHPNNRGAVARLSR